MLSISDGAGKTSPLSTNKQPFLQCSSQIREMGERGEMYKRKEEMQVDARTTGDQGCMMLEFGDFKGRSMKEVQALFEYLVKADVSPNTMSSAHAFVFATPSCLQGSATYCSLIPPFLAFWLKKNTTFFS